MQAAGLRAGARVREHEAGEVVVVHGGIAHIAHRGQARSTSNSFEHLVWVVAAAAAGAHDPVLGH